MVDAAVIAPVPAATAALLRVEVHRFARECGTRRAVPSRVRVGRLGEERTSLDALASYDAALRADLLTRALDGHPAPERLTAWLTRRGLPTVGDADLAWLAAAETAFGRHGLQPAPFFVVTRHGWLEVRSGESRRWRRVRATLAPG